MWSPPPCEGNSWRPSSGGGGAPRCAGPPQPRLPVRAAARPPYTCCRLRTAARPPLSAGPAPRPLLCAPAPAAAAAVVRQLRTAPARVRENAEVSVSPIPRTARLPRTLSALFLASTRGCCAPGRAARRPPPPPPRGAREGGRRGREAEPGSSVRVSGAAAGGGWRRNLRPCEPQPSPSLPPPLPFCALRRSSPATPALSQQLHKAIKYSLDIAQHLALKYEERRGGKSPQDFVFTTEFKCCQVGSLTS